MAQILPLPRRVAARPAPVRWELCRACEARMSDRAPRCPACGARRVAQEPDLDWTQHRGVVGALLAALALPALLPTLAALLLR